MNEQRIFIPGPEGDLEAVMSVPETTRAVAVLCHPHPQYGGNMDDDVLSVVGDALLAHGSGWLKFNFRGVGLSAGSYSGSEETGDLEAVLEFVGTEFPTRPLIVGGYSFGASVVSRLPGAVSAERVLLIAPPTAMMPMARPQIAAPVDVFAGDADSYVNAAAIADWRETRVHIIAGADHFFGGRLDDLRSAVADALA